jgi:hypothetical protein
MVSDNNNELEEEVKAINQKLDILLKEKNKE